MSKKLFVAAVAALALGATVHAQTNFQTFYDFGRKHFTTTLEGFHQDNWGNTLLGRLRPGSVEPAGRV